MASDEQQPKKLPCFGPRIGRSESATTMVAAGGTAGQKESGPEGSRTNVLLRSPSGLRPAAVPPPPSTTTKKLNNKVRAPAPPRLKAPQAKKQCVQCGATETTQWRMHPMGMATLCNACRIWLRPAEALREQVYFFALPATATAAAAAAAIVIPEQLAPPATKSALSSSKQCLHCKSSCTPRWRTGPVGPATLCNACGVRHCQGRLVDQYRPEGSPEFNDPEEEEQHQPPQPGAGDELLTGEPMPILQDQLLLDGGLPVAQMVGGGGDGGAPAPLMGEPVPLGQIVLGAIDGSPETQHTMAAGEGDALMGSLDPFLFEGPAAPLLIDDDDGAEKLVD